MPAMAAFIMSRETSNIGSASAASQIRLTGQNVLIAARNVQREQSQQKGDLVDVDVKKSYDEIILSEIVARTALREICGKLGIRNIEC